MSKPSFGHVKILLFEKQASNEQERTIEGYASTPAVDRQGEIILPTAFEESLPRYLANPVVTWAHDYWDIPIGRTVAAEVRPEGLWVRIQFGNTQRANEVWQAINDGLVRSLSVGFNGDYTPEWGYYDDNKRWVWTRVDLMEIAVVPIPANAQATFALAKSLGLPGPRRAGIAVEKRVTPFANLPTAPEDAPWDAQASERRVREWASSDGSGDKDTIDWQKYRQRFFWYDPDNAESFGGYKLPFADVIDGRLRAVWRGVAAAMAALLGARGGVDIPDADRRAVYNHIVRYYEKFDKEPPEFKSDWPANIRDVTFHNDELDIYEEMETEENLRRAQNAVRSVQSIVRHWAKTGGAPSARVVTVVMDTASAIAEMSADVAKAGRVLSAANRAAIEAAIAALQEVLARDDESRQAQDGKSVPIIRLRL